MFGVLCGVTCWGREVDEEEQKVSFVLTHLFLLDKCVLADSKTTRHPRTHHPQNTNTSLGKRQKRLYEPCCYPALTNSSPPLPNKFLQPGRRQPQPYPLPDTRTQPLPHHPHPHHPGHPPSLSTWRSSVCWSDRARRLDKRSLTRLTAIMMASWQQTNCSLRSKMSSLRT